jgi:hypothetical protein
MWATSVPAPLIRQRQLVPDALAEDDTVDTSSNSSFVRIFRAGPIRHLAAAGLSLVFVFLVFIVVNRFTGPKALDQSGMSPSSPALVETSQHQCIQAVIATLNLQQVDFESYEKIWALCGKEEYARLSLEDFTIRREKFIRQELDERVTLWMVVGITLAGIAMSIIQLAMSYKLAVTGHSEPTRDTTLSIEKGKIAVQSSVIGVIILVISLAFFVVYVKWIYSITETHIALPQGELQSGRQLPLEGALRPPSKASEQSNTHALPTAPEKQ